MKKKLGIIGGMGPLATAVLFERIIHYTSASVDQEHLRIFIDNNTLIPDRTNFLINKTKDPYPAILSSAIGLKDLGADMLIMPCNTAHYCYSTLQKEIGLPIISIIEATIEVIIKHPHLQKGLGLLGTMGLATYPNYISLLNTQQITCLSLDSADQYQISTLIYDIKATGITQSNQEKWQTILASLTKKGWSHFILGCTELALMGHQSPHQERFINSIDCLAKAAITQCGYPIKGDI
ncbi:MAG: amino acid racemase [Bacilli bacterium]